LAIVGRRACVVPRYFSNGARSSVTFFIAANI
jgi:hypothetical protein